MKKNEFINTVAQILTEWYPKTNFLSEKGYTIKADDLLKSETPKQISPIPTERPMDILPKGEYRITMDDLKQNKAPVTEVDPYGVSNDAGEPRMTAQQFRDYSEPSEPDPDEPMPHHPSNQNELSAFNKIDWKALFETIEQNTQILNRIQNVQDPTAQSQLRAKLQYNADLTAETPDEYGLLHSADIALLSDADIIWSEGGLMMFDDQTYANYDAFYNKAKEVWEAVQNGTYKSSPFGGSGSEAPYMRGYEPMSEQNINEIYKQFKAIIAEDISFPTTKVGAIYEQYKNLLKEDVDKDDFSTQIRGVYYQYAQGAEKATPTTKHPTRNPAEPKGNIVKEEIASVTTTPTTTPKPEEKPDAIIAKGQGMKKIGDATEKLGQIKKDEENKAKSTAATGGSIALAEYVESEILPAVLEIIKHSERPRAKKRELMEMFKLTN